MKKIPGMLCPFYQYFNLSILPSGQAMLWHLLQAAQGG